MSYNLELYFDKWLWLLFYFDSALRRYLKQQMLLLLQIWIIVHSLDFELWFIWVFYIIALLVNWQFICKLFVLFLINKIY